MLKVHANLRVESRVEEKLFNVHISHLFTPCLARIGRRRDDSPSHSYDVTNSFDVVVVVTSQKILSRIDDVDASIDILAKINPSSGVVTKMVSLNNEKENRQFY